MMDLRTIMDSLNGEKRVLLFLGSGFSVGAKSIKGQNLPTGGQLAKRIYQESGIIDGDTDLQFAAEKYITKYSISDLIKYIGDTFSIASEDNYYNSYSMQNWFRVYTTNYDSLFEKIIIMSPRNRTGFLGGIRWINPS